MIVRAAKEGDAAGIAKVHVQSWQETYRGIMPDSLLDNLSVERRQTWWESVIKEQLDANPVFVAEHDGEIVAFASGGAARDAYDKYDCELSTIYALKAVHGQGIGRQLMQQVAQKLHDIGYKGLMLWVAKGNPTEGFYAHMGGKPFTEKTEPFGDSEITEIAYGWDDIRTLLTIQEE